MKTFTTAQQAIEYSMSHDTITWATAEASSDLSAACDDWVETDTAIEYWANGDDSDGTDGRMAWRVHVAI